MKSFSKPILYNNSTVEVNNNLIYVNISGIIYFEGGIIIE